jgi:hypothetical protein
MVSPALRARKFPFYKEAGQRLAVQSEQKLASCRRWRRREEVRFAADLLVEGKGFEPSVPRKPNEYHALAPA